MLAAILAGGFGKRLRPLTDNCPKPMILLNGRPILEHQINWLKNYGINKVVFLVGYKKEKIIEYFGDGSKFGVEIIYVEENEPLGTGGAVKNAEHILSKEKFFLLLNGDIITDINPLLLVEKLENERLLGVIASVPFPSPYGILRFEGEIIREFVEKPILKDCWINAGVYALKPEAIKYFPERGDLEKTAFSKMAQDCVLGVVRYSDVFWKSVDTHKDLEEVEKYISEIEKKLKY